MMFKSIYSGIKIGELYTPQCTAVRCLQLWWCNSLSRSGLVQKLSWSKVYMLHVDIYIVTNLQPGNTSIQHDGEIAVDNNLISW